MNRVKISYLLLTLFLLFLSALSQPYPQETNLQSVNEEYIPAASTHASMALEAVYSAAGVPGLAAAISVDGEVVWESFLGFSDLAAEKPITPATRFRIASVSKAVTAVALARLWQEGIIDLDADVRKYVPDFPNKGFKITPRLLAGHLGGIRNYKQKDFADSSHIDHRHFETTSEALSIFKDDPLVAPPGTRYRYSVFGYTLLSAAMEGAAGDDFLSILKRKVLDPIFLPNTGPATSGVPDMATAYERTSEGGSSLAKQLDFSYKWAGGGLYSNPLDLVRLGSALLDPDIVSPDALKLLTDSQRTSGGQPTDVSLGWRLAIDSRSRKFIHHAGSISGGRAVILVYPEQSLSIAITSNQALAPLMIESTAQVIVEPFLLGRESKKFIPVRQNGRFSYAWTALDTEHRGILRYGTGHEDDRIDLPSALDSWSGRLGSPVEESALIMPMLLTGSRAFIPVITAAGAFAIDVAIGSDDSLDGSVSGEGVRVSGEFHAERIGNKHQ